MNVSKRIALTVLSLAGTLAAGAAQARPNVDVAVHIGSPGFVLGLPLPPLPHVVITPSRNHAPVYGHAPVYSDGPGYGYGHGRAGYGDRDRDAATGQRRRRWLGAQPKRALEAGTGREHRRGAPDGSDGSALAPEQARRAAAG